MKSLKLSAAVLAGLMVVFSSCKKDKDDAAPSKSKTELLTSAKSWKISGATLSGTSVFMAPIYDECDKSETQVYKADGTYKVSYQDNCNEAETGTWKFILNDTKLLLDGEDTLNVDQLDSKTFKVSAKDEDSGFPFVITYTAQ